MAPLLVAEHLQKAYATGAGAVKAVDDISLELSPGEAVAIVGPSGCGKSTLLHLCGAMDRPTAGRVRLEGVTLGDLADDALTHLRRRRVGFVFQFFNLLPTLTLLENIALPLLLDGTPAADALARARALAERVGLAARTAHYPAQLSGGEAQRAAVARAVIHVPALIVADEPTGSLDSTSGDAVLALLAELRRETGVAMLLATHAPALARSADRVIHMRDGRAERTNRPGDGGVTTV